MIEAQRNIEHPSLPGWQGLTLSDRQGFLICEVILSS